MASLTPQALVMSASSELRQATEKLKNSKIATPSEIIELEKQVELKRANLLKAVQNISTSQDEQEKANPNQKSNQPPLEKVKATQQETNIEMAIDSSQYNSIKIIPKPDELNDKNFPPSLLAAMELFSKVKMLQQGRELQTSIETFCRLLESGPPVEAISMGVACICWECGHCGLPVNVAEVTKNAPATATREELSKAPIAICSKCSGDVQTNLIRVTQPNGSMIPWIESKGEQKKKAEEAREKMIVKEKLKEKEEMDGLKKAVGMPKHKKKPEKKIKPNAACPCGSGKKYKKCKCGR